MVVFTLFTPDCSVSPIFASLMVCTTWLPIAVSDFVKLFVTRRIHSPLVYHLRHFRWEETLLLRHDWRRTACLRVKKTLIEYLHRQTALAELLVQSALRLFFQLRAIRFHIP